MSQVLEQSELAAPGEPLEFSTEDGGLRVIGFWMFLGAEFVLFASLFATYAVLHGMTANGPTSKQLFDIPGFTLETFFLLTSSFTCGIATFEMRRGSKKGVIGWLIITVLFGLGFLGFEIHEFVHDVSIGATWQKSAFLTGFYTLVGTHGCHVTMGILWMVSVIVQVWRRGINHMTARKIFIVGLYWHFLDVMWIFIFTIVYLSGRVL